MKEDTADLPGKLAWLFFNSLYYHKFDPMVVALVETIWIIVLKHGLPTIKSRTVMGEAKIIDCRSGQIEFVDTSFRLTNITPEY
jgi:hypothetical protein